MLYAGCGDDGGNPAASGIAPEDAGNRPLADNVGWDWTNQDAGEVLGLDSITGRFQHFTTSFDDIGAGSWSIGNGRLILNYEMDDDNLVSGIIVYDVSLAGRTLTLTSACDEIALDDPDDQAAAIQACGENPTSSWTR